jgi:hypothetical protein
VKLNEAEARELEKLEETVDHLLEEISRNERSICRETLILLDKMASAAAKIAYGSDNPQLLTKQMITLVAWTDHLDDEVWVKKFETALATRPLAHPWVSE